MVSGLWMRSVTDEVRPVVRVKLRPGRARCRGLVGYLEEGSKLLDPGAGSVGRVD